jgi:hypothetical protein
MFRQAIFTIGICDNFFLRSKHVVGGDCNSQIGSRKCLHSRQRKKSLSDMTFQVLGISRKNASHSRADATCTTGTEGRVRGRWRLQNRVFGSVVGGSGILNVLGDWEGHPGAMLCFGKGVVVAGFG